jgi:transcriptional regulator with XRE-family HTH domain
MKKTLSDYLEKLPKSRRKKIEKRSTELIAEEMTLQELRKAREKSQEVIAQKLHVKQAEVSKIERRTDMYVSTLRNYVQAMGGTLEIIAKFPKTGQVRISQFEVLDEEARKTVDA